MTKRPAPLGAPALVFAGASLLLSLTGCMVEQASGPAPHPARPIAVRGPAPVIIVDDYDYYPGYETYYSRSRREFVYREGNTWVRRPEPRGVSIGLLFSTPVVRLDFHDAPEQHHAAVVQSYPRSWAPPGSRPDPRETRRDERVQPQRVTRPVLMPAVVRGDYDYYPAYETYYSRSRHEYVYREGNTWVRRSEPRGMRREVLSAAAVVQLDFQDSPEKHHSTVVKQFPKNWKKTDDKRAGKDERNDDKEDEKRDRKDDDKSR